MKYFVIFIVLILWLGGCSATMMKHLYRVGIISDDYRYGDLYRLSNLPQFKDPIQPCPDVYTGHRRTKVGSNLYVIGDSFTEPSRLSQKDFRAGQYLRVRWDGQLQIHLDTARKNVLLIETIERNFREHFSQPVTNFNFVDDINPSSTPKPSSTQFTNRYTTLIRKIVDFIQAKGIEDRLETVLFSHDIFLWFRDVKASMNLNWFDRVVPTVGISQDQKHIFVSLDTDSTKHQTSSFTPMLNRELNALIDNLNVTADRYRAAGFDAVYLSIIPNKVSILDPTQGSYNHLIERVEQNPRLRVPVVSVYDIYRKQSMSVYTLGDSHWSCTGRRIWLEILKNRADL